MSPPPPPPPPPPLPVPLPDSDDAPPLVVVVDDDAAMRDSLVWLLQSMDWEVAAHASVDAFLAAGLPDRPGCLVLDVRMPGQGGFDLQGRLGGQQDLLPVIFVTGHGDVPMAVRAIKGGAFDFLEKPFCDEALLGRVVATVERSRTARAAARQHRLVAERLAGLTRREREVLDLVAAGRLNKQIAHDLAISIKTVEVHRANVMDKMGVRSVAELTRLVVAAGLGASPGEDGGGEGA